MQLSCLKPGWWLFHPRMENNSCEKPSHLNPHSMGQEYSTEYTTPSCWAVYLYTPLKSNTNLDINMESSSVRFSTKNWHAFWSCILKCYAYTANTLYEACMPYCTQYKRVMEIIQHIMGGCSMLSKPLFDITEVNIWSTILDLLCALLPINIIQQRVICTVSELSTIVLVCSLLVSEKPSLSIYRAG